MGRRKSAVEKVQVNFRLPKPIYDSSRAMGIRLSQAAREGIIAEILKKCGGTIHPPAIQHVRKEPDDGSKKGRSNQ